MQHNLFTEEQIPTLIPTIAKPIVSLSTFYHGDCLVEMDKIADKSVDMILCDLPYGTTACKWDSVIPFEPLWKHYERVIKDNGAIVLTGSQPFTSALIMSNINWFKYELIWDKVKTSQPHLSRIKPMQRHENICVFGKSKVTYNPIMTEKDKPRKAGGKRISKDNEHKLGLKTTDCYLITHSYPDSFFVSSNADNTTRVHPTQKPIKLFENLIKTYTNEGNTVLDNCMGSGTTGVACKKTGRHFIGIEQDETYFKLAVDRVTSYCD